MGSRASLSLVVVVAIGCGPQVVLDSDGTDASGGEESSTSGLLPTSSSASATISTSAADPSLDGGVTSLDAADTDGPSGAGVCKHTCTRDADCIFMGQDAGLTCRDGQCYSDLYTCESPADCVPILTGWAATPCTKGGGECENLMRICVDLGDGVGGCATPASAVACASLMQGEAMVLELDTGRPVLVCGNTDGLCHPSGYCHLPCRGDASCGGLTCNPTTGVCECSSDAQCVALGLEGGVCVDGACNYGCTADSDCENFFDGGFVTCGP